MQTHTDRRSPSQVKVGHRGGVEQDQVHVLTRLFHAHPSLEPHFERTRVDLQKRAFNLPTATAGKKPLPKRWSRDEPCVR
jgi:hypothetical protein